MKTSIRYADKLLRAHKLWMFKLDLCKGFKTYGFSLEFAA